MTPTQIKLISESWEELSWKTPNFVASFHVHLFNVDHEAQSLFSSGKGEKIAGMMKVIDVAIGLLDQWELFTRSLREFGQRHIAYGVLESHYLGFGDAFMLTLDEFLGSDFTPETRDAWQDFYRLMTKSMIKGSKL